MDWKIEEPSCLGGSGLGTLSVGGATPPGFSCDSPGPVLGAVAISARRGASCELCSLFEHWKRLKHLLSSSGYLRCQRSRADGGEQVSTDPDCFCVRLG